MAIPRLGNIYKFKPIDDTPSLDAYSAGVNDFVRDYDTNLDNRDKIIKALGSIQSNAAGNQYLTKLGETVNKALDGVASSVSGVKRWDLADDTIRELGNKLATDKVLQAIKTSQDNHVEGMKTQAELAKKGEVVNLNGDYEDFKPINPDGTVNVYNPLYQNRADYYGAMKKIAKDLPTQIDIAMTNDQNVNGYLKINQVKRVAAGIKEQMLPSYYKQYISSDEGLQQAIVARNKYKKLGLSDTDIEKRVNQELMDTVKTSLDTIEQEAYENKPQLITDSVEARRQALEDRRLNRIDDLQDWKLKTDYQNAREDVEWDRRTAEQRYQEKVAAAERKARDEAAQKLRRDLQEDAQKQQTELEKQREDARQRDIRLRAELAQKTAVEKAKAKASGKASQDNIDVLSTASGITHTSARVDGVTTLKSSEYTDDLAKTVHVTPGKGLNAWSNVAFDKDQIKDFNVDDYEIKSFKPEGINAYNENADKFDGAWYGTLTYLDKEGKEHTMSANVVNTDNELRGLYSGVSQLNKQAEAMLKMNMNGKPYIASKYFDADANFFPLAKMRIYFQLVRTKEGVKAVPVVKDKDADGKDIYMTIAGVKSTKRKELGLDGIKGQYSIAEIRTMADNDFVDHMKAHIASKKNLDERAVNENP